MLAFSTGLDSFMNPQDIGPMYPFVGAEWLFVAAAFVLWLLWHAAQIRGETRENREATQLYEDIGLDRAMYHGGSALMATDEEWKATGGAAGAHWHGGPGATESPDPRLRPPGE